VESRIEAALSTISLSTSPFCDRAAATWEINCQLLNCQALVHINHSASTSTTT
jgi:hypothetical protein